MDRIEGNKLIADFMGWKHHIDADYDAYEMKKLKYHTSWDWLMPVVDKIEALGVSYEYGCAVQIENNYCKIRLGGEPDNSDCLFWYDTSYDKSFSSPTKIVCTWQAVINFILWYNEQK